MTGGYQIIDFKGRDNFRELYDIMKGIKLNGFTY